MWRGCVGELTGQTFAEVNATVKRDAADHTVKPHEMYRDLWERGYFLLVVRRAALGAD